MDNSALHKTIEKEGLNKKPMFNVFYIVSTLLGVLFIFIANRVDYEKGGGGFFLVGLGCLFLLILIIFGSIFLASEQPKGDTWKRWKAVLALPVIYITLFLIIVGTSYFLEPILTDIFFKFNLY